MRLLLLSLVLCSFVLVANTLDIRPISIEDVLRENPGLKAELRKKIEESKNEPTSVPATASAPATTTAATTTTTPSPQADSPPSTTPESTTTATRQTGRRRRPGAGARRRLRVSNNEAEEAPIQNGRTFPQ